MTGEMVACATISTRLYILSCSCAYKGNVTHHYSSCILISGDSPGEFVMPCHGILASKNKDANAHNAHSLWSKPINYMHVPLSFGCLCSPLQCEMLTLERNNGTWNLFYYMDTLHSPMLKLKPSANILSFTGIISLLTSVSLNPHRPSKLH